MFLTAPGKILDTAPAVTFSELGEMVEFNCTVYGNTTPIISWYGPREVVLRNSTDDERIHISKTIHSSSITTSLIIIRSLSRADNGTYVCAVNNTDTSSILVEELQFERQNYHLRVLGNSFFFTLFSDNVIVIFQNNKF